MSVPQVMTVANSFNDWFDVTNQLVREITNTSLLLLVGNTSTATANTQLNGRLIVTTLQTTGNLAVNGQSTFTGTVTVANTMTVANTLTLTRGLSVGNDVSVTGNVTASYVKGNAVALTSMNASELTTGTVPLARLILASASSNGIVTTTTQTFGGNKTINGDLVVTGDASASNVTAAFFIGGASQLSAASSTANGVVTISTQTFSGTKIFLNDLAINTTARFYFDGGGDTYITEIAPNTLDLYAGGHNFRLTSTNLTTYGDLIVAPTKKIYLDGGDNTYIQEVSGNNLRIVADGNERLRAVGGQGVQITGALTIPTNTPIYFDGSFTGGNYIYNPAGDTLVSVVGGGERLRVNTSGITVTGNVAATNFSGNGTTISALNASNLSTGTVPVARLPVATSSVVGVSRPDASTITIDGSGVLTANVNAAVPAGTIVMTARSTSPTGWLLCDGSNVSRTTYGVLFSAIGTAFGSGDGSTTFTLPNMVNRFPVGAGSTYALAATGGSTTHSHTVTTSVTVDAGGDHNHSGSTGSAAPGTDTQGAHSHTINSHTHSLVLTTTGAHTHSVSGTTDNINHTHSFSGSGSDTITISGTTSSQDVPHTHDFSGSDNFTITSGGPSTTTNVEAGGAAIAVGDANHTHSSSGSVTISGTTGGTNSSTSHNHTFSGSDTANISISGTTGWAAGGPGSVGVNISGTAASNGDHTHTVSSMGGPSDTGTSSHAGHSHTVNAHTHTIGSSGTHTHTASATSSSNTVSHVPPYLALNYIIKT